MEESVCVCLSGGVLQHSLRQHTDVSAPIADDNDLIVEGDEASTRGGLCFQQVLQLRLYGVLHAAQARHVVHVLDAAVGTSDYVCGVLHTATALPVRPALHRLVWNWRGHSHGPADVHHKDHRWRPLDGLLRWCAEQQIYFCPRSDFLRQAAVADRVAFVAELAGPHLAGHRAEARKGDAASAAQDGAIFLEFDSDGRGGLQEPQPDASDIGIHLRCPHAM